MTSGLTVNPRSIRDGLSMFKVFQTLVHRRGRTIEELKAQPRVRFTNDELDEVTTIQGKPFNRGRAHSNRFANDAIALALGGNKLAAVLFRKNQFKTIGLPGIIHGNKPAVIDLGQLYVRYLGSANDMPAQLIETEPFQWIKPEDIANKESFNMGEALEASFRTTDSGDELLVTAPAILGDASSEGAKEPFANVGEEVEIRGLVLKGLENGAKLEVSTKTPFSGVRTIVLPLVSSYGWIERVPLNIEYKKR
ncbi:MAG: hypothetical protein HYZ79_07665 [Candidatus Melainabacteria bacterium]|nr:hypothetical protein [Candidatus Melainabacteria bacterium]